MGTLIRTTPSTIAVIRSNHKKRNSDPTATDDLLLKSSTSVLSLGSFSPVNLAIDSHRRSKLLPCFKVSAISNSSTGSQSVSSPSSISEEKEDIASSLDKIEVFDLNGNAIIISDLWKDRKTLVAFARHFG